MDSCRDSMRIEEPSFHRLMAGVESRDQLWQRILRAMHVEEMLEVGVWTGQFARRILESCGFVQRYYMIDPWAQLPDWNKPLNVSPKIFEEVYEEAMAATDFAAEKRVVLRGRTKEVVAAIPDESLDLAYIDGDHTLRGITIDLVKILPKIKEGGLIGGDDFLDTPWQHDLRYEPTLVCPFAVYFAEAMDLPIMALPFGQFVLQKSTASSFSFIDSTGTFGDLRLNKSPPGNRGSAARRLLRRVLARFGLV